MPAAPAPTTQNLGPSTRVIPASYHRAHAPCSPFPSPPRRLAALALSVALPACADLEPLPVPAQVISCDSRAAASSLEAVSIGAAAVHIDDPGVDRNLLALRADVPATLAKLWPGVADITV